MLIVMSTIMIMIMVMVLGRHYLSNTTCLIRPHLLYAFLFVPRATPPTIKFASLFAKFDENRFSQVVFYLVYIYIYIHTPIHVYTCIYIYIYTHIYVYVYSIYTYIYIYICIHTYINIYIYVWTSGSP